ncbi:hypothetical protein BEI59_23890 [Eisenbergiella tayi]|uniref:Methyltransferase FkbM domain-containing protein n=1 Tax=Eisenbergiella tayi TaxID=1432052 RepID=A0A1E3UBT4_9FIRM|nr:FkbM family methyltransferase [Eisenbergiella tayi]ODR46792.1 hypothetical protein BEI59_23890 [Eisenbergiella tayi]RJW35681.1 FkbM family methyltransferase [Lachnospiraceae bacterium TF09-5]
MNIDEIFRMFHKRKNSLEWTEESMKKDIQNYLEKIVLYGAGSAGIAFMHYLNDAGIFPVCFSDGDNEKQGEICEGLEIISPESITEKVGIDALVIVTINTDGQNYCRDFKTALLEGGHQGVYKRLHEFGCINVIDYTYFRKCFRLFAGGKYNLPAVSDVYLMEEHEEDIKTVYEMLADEESKKIFLDILQFRLLDDSVEIPVVSEKNMYFEYDLFPKAEDEILIDCGACGGSSLEIFLRQTNGKFERYYGLEPDYYNFNRLEKYLEGLPEGIREKMQGVNKAAYSIDGKTSFFVLNGPGTFAADIGKDSIDTIKIDTLLECNRASYIKMNIEGSEVAALKGAAYTIKTYKPKMAIMGYHKTSDLWEVPLLMKQYRPDYIIHLRSYMKNVAFCYFAH